MKSTRALFLRIAATAVLIGAVNAPVTAAESSTDKQQKLFAILQSDGPKADKAIACKQLAVWGNKEAVPALAPLLLDKELISWARIALEAIPAPEAAAALRDALPKVNGNMLIGVINSIGVKRDEKAVDALATKLGVSETDIVAAAAVALGRIGGKHSATALSHTLANARPEILSSAAEGCILCAERFTQDGNITEATSLYDAVRNKAGLSTQKRLEATRGAILARGSAGLPLLLEQLRSPGNAAFGMGLRTARELKGQEVTESLGKLLDNSEADRQVPILLALADRNDPAVLPKLLQIADKGSKNTRVAALGLLDRFSDVSTVPILLNAAADTDKELAEPAKATLTRMEGKSVDAELLKKLPQASGKTRQVIIELAALRRIEGAVPAVLSSAEDSDANVRRAAFTTLSTLGAPQHASDLARLLSKTQDADDREVLESSLTTLCGRHGAKCLPHVTQLARSTDSNVRIIGLRALAMIGGREALDTVVAAANDTNEEIQDEAVGILATWPNNWPEDTAVAEPLLNLAKTGRKPAHKIQGVRGYLLALQENKNLSNAAKLDAIDRLLPILQRAPEKRLAIATLSTIPTAKTLELLSSFVEDTALAEEASLAVVTVASAKSLQGASKELRQKSLQLVLDKSKNDATREKASNALKAIQ